MTYTYTKKENYAYLDAKYTNTRLCVYIYIYIQTYRNVSTYIHTHIHAYMHVYMHSYVQTYITMHIYISTNMCICMHLFIYSFIHVWVCICCCSYTPRICVLSYIFMHIVSFTYSVLTILDLHYGEFSNAVCSLMCLLSKI